MKQLVANILPEDDPPNPTHDPGGQNLTFSEHERITNAVIW